ncbi:MAG: DUF1028 domain-containing protein [Alphaproteobacteria bacterium]|nr:DUF1028 domain-containing protein [Alphaproteobacteria bacterium]
MTFTILARCPRTERVGVGIATYSLGVGGYCPFFVRDRAVLSTQAFANSALGHLAVEHLAAGVLPRQVLVHLAAADPGFSYRQVGIVAADGVVAMHTGENCRPWAGHRTGDGYAVFGNVLAGEATAAAMEESWENSSGSELDERLLRAVEAGRDAGGQAGATGEHLPERSAALVVRGADCTLDLDLRVDLHDDAVTELRRVHAGYVPYLDYYALRARDPANTPPQDVWARSLD